MKGLVTAHGWVVRFRGRPALPSEPAAVWLTAAAAAAAAASRSSAGPDAPYSVSGGLRPSRSRPTPKGVALCQALRLGDRP